MIVRSSIRQNYTIVCNKALNDERLSFEAKGLLCYLLSKPDTWKVRLAEIMSAGGCGRGKAIGMLRSLRECGYTSVHFSRDEAGKILAKDLVIHEEPLAISRENHTMAKPYYGKTILRENHTMAKPYYGKPDHLVITNKAVKTEKVVKTEKAVKNKKAVITEALPECIDPGLWEEWRSHRKAMRRPMTKFAERQLLKKLEAVYSAGRDPNAAIRHSLANGWQGVYEPVATKSKPSGIAEWLADQGLDNRRVINEE